MLNFFLTGLIQSAILMLVALAITIPFRFLRQADLTAEGSYPLGGALAAALLLAGGNPLFATFTAAGLAGLLGIGTALLHKKLRIEIVLAGIILSTMVYSLDLRMLQRPNISILQVATIFGSSPVPISYRLLLLGVIIIICTTLLRGFFATEKGLRLRACGYHAKAATRLGIDENSYIFLGLFLGNLLAGLAGALAVQINGYADVGMGVGMVIHALAALLLGESILGTASLTRQLCAPLCGALVYQQIQGLALYAGLLPSDLKFITGALVIGVIALSRRKL
jgi:putative ABC transport system permease protein